MKQRIAYKMTENLQIMLVVLGKLWYTKNNLKG